MRVHSEDPRQAPGLKKPSWDGRSYGGTLGHRVFMAMARAAGTWPSYLLLAFVVPYYCLIARKSARASRGYLVRILGPARFPRSLARTYRHFFEFGQVLVDRFIFYARGTKSFTFESNGWENIEKGLAGGKGVILLSAHVGGWEIASGIRSRFEWHRLPVPLNVAMFVPEEGRVPSFVELLEREGDIKVIPIGAKELPLEIVAALGRGEVVAFHGDRVISEARLTIPFLGAPASFPTGPWQIAAATGAPVVVAFLVKEGWRRYRFETFPPVTVIAPRKDRAKVLEEHVLAFARTLASVLARHPYQWFNFYEFWQ